MFVISPTDNDWFEFLKNSGFNSFINFWTPTPWNIKRLTPGDRWYFMLKSPIRQLGGFGEYVDYQNLTALKVWEQFGHRNGCFDKSQFIDRIQAYIDKNSESFGGKTIDINNYEIGCITLNNCQFWEEEKYLNPQDYQIDFAVQVVKYKYFDQEDPFVSIAETKGNYRLLDVPRENNKREVNQRKGQSEFKGKILKAYNNKCCISNETCPELLEAAHLQPYVNELSNHIQNGILLRVDLHRLFDNGLLFIDNSYKISISSLMQKTNYFKYNGLKISLPSGIKDHPSKESLELKRIDFRI